MMKLMMMMIWIFLASLGKKNWWVVSSLVMIGLWFMLEILPFSESLNHLMSWVVVDFIGFSLMFLSFYLTILMINSSWLIKKVDYFFNYFMLSVIMLLMVLLMCFSVSSLILFYFFFEVSLIPTLFIIMGWGFQLERVQAGVYFLFYTISASLPLLLNLVYYYSSNGSFILGLLVLTMGGMEVTEMLEWFFLLSLIMAFLVKLPMFMFHLWLPKAHVEAPVAGSMILAGVLLKLGGYGLMRVFPLVISSSLKYSFIFMSLGLASMVFVGMMCWRLNDLKALVAYSSVAHMGLVMCGLMTFVSYGNIGVLVMMIGHGLSSSGMFCLVNMVYERFGSRSLYLNKGILLMLPVLSYLFFLLCAANISAPPTINLLGEIFLLVSVMGFSFYIMLLFSLGSFFGAVFTLFLYSFSQHGKSYKLAEGLGSVNINEFHLILMHLIPLNILVLKSDLFFC
uniref:NADH-ubiquinone oxidoreductase chain 4 n=1 Tax=Orthonychiurus folsomi TaxID=2581074 RepID=A0A650DQY5_9HEXA|nr:NADH dehydrogenase subunit 4 [Orthonychiurus folsomi]